MDDLINEFITETAESLSLLDSELVKLEQNPEDEKTLGNIFRIVHTIKGTCGFLGLPRLQAVAHASENVLGKIRDKELEATPEAVTLVLASLDNIKGLLDHLTQTGAEPEGDDSALIASLNRFAGEEESHNETPGGHSVSLEETAEEDFSHFFQGDDELNALIASAPTEIPAEAASMVPAKAALPPAIVENRPVTEAKPVEKSEPKDNSAAAGQSIRVNIDVLENLMQMVSELVLTRNQLMQIVRTKPDQEFLTPLQQLSHITSELQEGVMKTRMQPIGNAWSKFPRLVRDLSLELDKKIDLRMVGAETELDRQLLELIKDPLTHMVRNSCDHGLETTAERRVTNKPEMGTVTLSAYHEGGHIVIDIADDGRGLNVARITEKAIANGLATASEMAGMSEQQIMMFIFRAGFSTAEKVTSVSGRGVGMDVVRTNIEKMGGTVELSSELGRGSKFSIKIPLTLAIVSVLLVDSGGQKLAIPQINVKELIRVSPGSEYAIESINRAPVVRLREKLLPLVGLSQTLGLEEYPSNWAEKKAYVIICNVGGFDFGIIVDRVYDTEEIVVKPVSDMLKSIPVYSGNTILGDGTVIMILDPNGIAKTLGGIEIGDVPADVSRSLGKAQENSISFLLVGYGGNGRKAVPLELVSRLEKIPVGDIETAGDGSVVQYRGDLMQLVKLDPHFTLPGDGTVSVIVFTYDRKTIGLIVESIIDIADAVFDVKLLPKDREYLGSMVIDGKATDIVDVASMLQRIVGMVDLSQADVSHAKECNILLVEDSPFFRNITQPFLSAIGYKVTMAENGSDALKVMQSHPGLFNLVVTDLEMPVMNGFDFTAACRKSADKDHLPIIAYTSSISNEVIQRGKDVGLNDCILKTDRKGLLKAISHNMLNGHAEQRV